MAPLFRRNARRAAVALAANMALRPILFAVISVFVLLPLVVYNVATLDYFSASMAAQSTFLRGSQEAQQLHMHKSHGEQLPPCLNVSSTEFLSPDGISAIKKRCMKATNTTEPMMALSNDNVLPYLDTVVHFVHVPLDAVPLLEGEASMPETDSKEMLTFLQYAAVQSIRNAVKPKVMVLHYIDKEPRGVWYTQCQRHLSLHKVVAPKVTTAKGSSSLNRYQRRQLMELLLMLRVLAKQGGVAFSDFNTFVLRDTLRQVYGMGFVAGQAAGYRPTATPNGGKDTEFQVAMNILQARAKHPFLKYLQDTLADFIARDDPQLHLLTLEQLIGRVMIRKYLQDCGDGEQANESSSMMRDVVVGSSQLFDGLPLRSMPRFLHTTITADASRTAQHLLQGVTGFHLAKYDFHAKSTATDGLQELQTLQKRIVAAEDIIEGKSLLEAVLRFATVSNTTAELEPFLLSIGVIDTASPLYATNANKKHIGAGGGRNHDGANARARKIGGLHPLGKGKKSKKLSPATRLKWSAGATAACMPSSLYLALQDVSPTSVEAATAHNLREITHPDVALASEQATRALLASIPLANDNSKCKANDIRKVSAVSTHQSSCLSPKLPPIAGTSTSQPLLARSGEPEAAVLRKVPPSTRRKVIIEPLLSEEMLDKLRTHLEEKIQGLIWQNEIRSRLARPLSAATFCVAREERLGHPLTALQFVSPRSEQGDCRTPSLEQSLPLFPFSIEAHARTRQIAKCYTTMRFQVDVLAQVCRVAIGIRVFRRVVVPRIVRWHRARVAAATILQRRYRRHTQWWKCVLVPQIEPFILPWIELGLRQVWARRVIVSNLEMLFIARKKRIQDAIQRHW
ncbi:hypothetical protein FI667_g8734, partial [Globisporangium splendens]